MSHDTLHFRQAHHIYKNLFKPKTNENKKKLENYFDFHTVRIQESVTFIHSYDTLKYNSRESIHIKVHFCTHRETITGYIITIHTIIYKKIKLL